MIRDVTIRQINSTCRHAVRCWRSKMWARQCERGIRWVCEGGLECDAVGKFMVFV